jgi:hypothetical protein
MKYIFLVGVAILLAACSSHRVRCNGALRPINGPAAAAKPAVTGSAVSPRDATAAPGPAAAHPQSLPVVPRP